MVKKANVLNLIVAVIAIILILTISVKFFASEENTLTFSGPNIYRAVYIYEIIEEQGFPVNLYVEGSWVGTGESFKGSGLIVDSDLGEFTILYEGREIKIGGISSAKEDVSATKLKFELLSESVIKIGIESLSYNSLDSLYLDLDDLFNSLVKEEVYETGIRGEIMIDTNTTMHPTLVQEIDNILKPKNEITLYEKGLRISFEDASLDDLDSINTLLKSKNIISTKIATSRLELLIRAKEKVTESRETLLQKAESKFNIYLFRIISEPLK